MNKQEITTIVAKIAVAETMKLVEQQREEQKKKLKERRLRNTKLLLRNYRTFAKHCSEVKLELNELDEMFELAEQEADEFKVLSIKNSKEKTLAIVKFINRMLKMYEIMCKETDKPEDLRRYSVVYSMYFDESKKTAEQIAAEQHVAVRTVFSDIEKACKELSVLIFGIDGMRV